MNTYFIDYATRGSSKKLAVAMNEGPPVFVSDTLFEFVRGTGTMDPNYGQTSSLPRQVSLFPGSEQTGTIQPSLMGNEDLVSCVEGMGTYKPEKGTIYPSPQPGDIIVIETNFEPHDPDERERVIDVAKERDIQILTLPIRITGKYKKILDDVLESPDYQSEEDAAAMKAWASERNIINHKEDDLRAVEAIRQAYLDGQTTASPKYASWEKKDNLQIFQLLRTGGNLTPKTPWVREQLRKAPRMAMVKEQDIADVYFQDGEWQLELLLLTIIAVETTENRAEFDRRMGLYGNGYPTIFRSSFVRRAVTLAERDVQGKITPAWQYHRKLAPREHIDAIKHRMSQVRRATRIMRNFILASA